MARNSEYPIRINPSPIVESDFEIRYTSDYPDDAIFGIIFAAVKDIFGAAKPKNLPILQVPEAVRTKDPNLRYQSHHRLEKENLNLGIGPHSITFGNVRSYVGWEEWSSFFFGVLTKIRDTDVIAHVERIGLRYINMFGFPIFNKIDAEIMVIGHQLSNESTNLRTEFYDSGYRKVLQIANQVSVMVDSDTREGSLIDIDCIIEINQTGEVFFNQYENIVELAHDKAESLFFNLLKDDFLESLNPEYEE